MKKKNKLLIVIIACILSIVIAICVGSVSLTPMDVLKVMGLKLFQLPISGKDVNSVTISILWDIRIPRAICSFFVGAALAVSGSVMQSILRNPLASSYTLGVSSGASLGASLIITGIISLPISNYLAMPVVGFIFGLGTVLLAVYLANKFDTGLHNPTIILIGMVLSLFVNAILTLLSALRRENLQQLIYWQMGSFSSRGWQHAAVIVPVTICLSIIILVYAKEMDILTFGEETAYAIGVDTKKVKLRLLILSTILTGTAVCFTGIIGFVDLIAPHMVRKLFGPNHKYLIPFSALIGGTFMAIADTVARTILSPLELPVGAITALIGAPFFAYIYLRKRGDKIC